MSRPGRLACSDEDEGWGKSVTNIAVTLGVVPVLMIAVRFANLTIVVVVITTVAQVVEADTKGLPHGTWLSLTVGGLVTTIAVAAAEYAVLRRDGETWRW